MVPALVFHDPAIVGVLLSFYRSILFPAFTSSSYPPSLGKDGTILQIQTSNRPHNLCISVQYFRKFRFLQNFL